MIWQLVKKDLTYLSTSLKSTLIYTMLIGMFLPMAGLGFGIAMPAFVCYIGFYSVLAYEERSKMQLLNATLPVTRKEICLAKYVYSFLIIGAAIVLSLAGSLIGSATHGEVNLLLENLPLYITLMAASGLIYIAVILPCVFYFGTIKARYVLMAIYIFGFIAATNINFSSISNIAGKLKYLGSPIILLWVVSAAVCLISIGISLKIWEKKDIN